MSASASVFLVCHVHILDRDEEDLKVIGIYSSREQAESAVARASTAEGFREHLDGFDISEYQLDRDNWMEGFVTERL